MKKTTLFLFSLFLTIGAMAQDFLVKDKVTEVKTGYYVVVGTFNPGNGNGTSIGPAYYDNSLAEKYRLDVDKTIAVGESLPDLNYVWYVENNGATITLKNMQDEVYFVRDANRNENFKGSETANLTLKVSQDASKFFMHLADYPAVGYIHCNSPGGDPCLSYWDSHAESNSTAVRFEFFEVEELHEYEHNAGNINRGDRGLTSFTITDGENSLTVNSIQTSAQAPIYVDKSAEKLTTKQGATLKFTDFNYTGSWMHAYAYIDYNKDYEFNLTNNNNGEGEGEIVSYNYFDGYDITGITSNQGSAMGNTYGYGESKAMPAFTLPRTLPAGEYRVRIKIDWNNLDANYGASDIAANGGCQCDFTIVVEEAVGNEIAKNALNNAVNDALALFNAVNIGTSVGRYSSSIDGYEAEFNDIMSYKSSITEETPSDEIDAKTARVREIIASFSLNMPKAGDYIRIKSIEGWNDDARYLGAQNSTANTSRAEFVAEAGANTIFYFDGENLISYALGNYLVNNSSFLGYDGVQVNGTKIEFRTSNNTSNRHAYNISFIGDDDGDGDPTRWLYTNTGNFTDAGSDCGTEGGYNFNLEPVAELPVTVTAAGYATFFAPVAVQATGVKAYTVAINGEWATLTEIESGVIPANTGVVLEAAENSYNLAITTTEATATSALLGTVATKYIAGEAYVLSKPDGKEIGFYPAKLNFNATYNKITNEADIEQYGMYFQNNSHKAYLKVPASAALSAGFRFSFGGTTAVEDVEIENEREEIYDLTGRKLSEITKSGIYIINGKKVLVK